MTDTRVRTYYDAISAGDIDAVCAMFAPDAIMRDPVGVPPATDDAARRQRYAGIAAVFASFRIEPGRIIAAADEAAAQWSAHGVTRDGRNVSFDGISTFVFDADARIAQMSAYWDATSMRGGA